MRAVFRTPIVAIVALSLAGCAQNPDGSTPNIIADIGAAFGGDDPTLSPEQNALRRQERDYAQSRLTATAVGAVIGAGVGALTGAAVDGRDGAIMGGGAGALAGGGAAYVGATYLTRDRQRFVASRDTLQGDLDAARADTLKMQKNVAVAQAALGAQTTQLNAVRADLRAGRISEDEARRRAAVAGDDLASVRALRQESEKRVAGLQQSVTAHKTAGQPTQALEAQRAQQAEQVAALQRIERSMVQSINRTPANIRPAV